MHTYMPYISNNIYVKLFNRFLSFLISYQPLSIFTPSISIVPVAGRYRPADACLILDGEKTNGTIKL